ncbi:MULTISPECIES: 5-oxoprolinase subunit PxpB [Paenibacillus]|uniref:5-oxoprolinase subunit PxpB n=1 Tax=Paenibacillus TaxID=44249 RepID=UPI000178A793|nr:MULTISPECIES: 5-oxoprolinase subunit PxpB [Paenibacillus]ACX66055.1 Allophanate hydrolase subunit 1 [Paenibacillus sp. Y412MC10]MCM3258527.1 5-oxoprolinase subunit PxpB [Paenibacillus lautus]
MSKSYTFYPLGDSAVLIQFADFVSERVHRQVTDMTRRLEREPFMGWIECIPSFTSIAVYYDFDKIEKPAGFDTVFAYVCSMLEQRMEANTADENRTPYEVVDIPVCYGGEFGPDLDEVARKNHLSPLDVVKIHSGQDYLIYAIGFAPGFPYVGGIPEQIATQRRKTPRLRIPAGSVGIAGTQTGIYPIETPGGWQIIGRTPLALFRPGAEPPTLLKSGQYIRFRPIQAEEYERLREVSL